jgi:hypothetical protein
MKLTLLSRKKGVKEIRMTRLEADFDSKHDSMHALAAEQHTHAAYEHWAAHYRQKRGAGIVAQEFGKSAHQHSMRAAELSNRAMRQEQSVQEPLAAAAAD